MCFDPHFGIEDPKYVAIFGASHLSYIDLSLRQRGRGIKNRDFIAGGNSMRPHLRKNVWSVSRNGSPAF